MAHELTDLTLLGVIERSANVYSNRPSLTYWDEPAISYSELEGQIRHLSDFLKDRGVVPGDRVALLGENSPQWGISYFAITSMGAVVVPILPDFHPSEVHHIIRHSESTVIFVSEKLFPKIEEMDDGTFRTIILMNDFSIVEPDTPRATLKKILADGSRELRKIKNLAFQFVGLTRTRVHEDDLASIVYTSGTTGHSKGVMLSHKNIVSNAAAAAKIPPVISTDRFLSILPLAHVYECTIGLVIPVLCGASVYYLKKPPTAPVLLPALAAIKPTMMLTVPLIIEKMYKTKILPEIERKKILRTFAKVPLFRRGIHKLAGSKLKATFGNQLKFFGIGGASLSAEVEQFLREAGFPYAIGYGLTETSPLIAGSNAVKTKFRSTGPNLEGVEVKIDHPDPVTGVGEITVRGPNVMKGYYKDPEQTSAMISADGWLKTGDLGCFDKDGYLYIKGRLKNVIIGASGENIYPEAIESVINRSEYVLESIVFQQEGSLVASIFLDYEKLDQRFSEENLDESQARVKIKELLESLRKQVNEQVSSFSRISRFIEQTEPFEKTPTQKIKRYLYVH